jgi:5-methyltetrahydropteroyltriglutamate--homocysteine methyltransferase
MPRSVDRILTTHVGSLCRPSTMIDPLQAKANGLPYDERAFEPLLRHEVAEVVAQQSDAGIDIPSDGEFSKPNWTAYVLERLSGLDVSRQQAGVPRAGTTGEDRRRFADFYRVYDDEISSAWIPAELRQQHATDPSWTARARVACTGPIGYVGAAAIARDIANLQAALAEAGLSSGFLPLAAPASIEATVENRYYPTDDDYVVALADGLRPDYRAVVDSGLILQVDDAFIPYNYDRFLAAGRSMADYLRNCELRIEALNDALAGLPPEQIRYHVCWGSWAGPHTTDIPLRDIASLILKVNAGSYAIEAANPRHEWEWTVWRDIKLPDDKVLIPGVVTHSTNVVEHPETVAQRIERFASVVGREQVIAGTDCGFAQGWSTPRTHPSVQWAKLRALTEGARLASERLWS